MSGIKRTLCAVAVVCLLGTASASARPIGDAAPKVSCAKRLWAIAKRNISPWWGVAAAVVMIGPPAIDQAIDNSLHHDAISLFSSHDKHIGSGIYFSEEDWTVVLASMTPAQRAIVDDTQNNPSATVKLFTDLLFGDYDESRIPKTEHQPGDPEPRHYDDYVTGIRASHFLLARGEPRGVCKHKAVVLVAYLRRAGLDAKVEQGMTKDDIGHAYVVAASGSVIGDPTNGITQPAGAFRAQYIKYRMDYFGRPIP